MRTYRSAILIVLGLVIRLLTINGMPVTFEGYAPQYAGDSLKFFVYGDLISYRETPLTTIPVSEDGYFHGECDLTYTEEIFTLLGIYQAYFYAEPGHAYTLVLPPRKDKKMKDILNPYFRPVPVHIGIHETNREELNMLIDRFDIRYNPYFNAWAKNIYVNKRNDTLALFTSSVKESFSGIHNVYFLQYMNARLLTLKVMAISDRANVIDDYIGFAKDIGYYNPAYMELFNQVFNSYLKYLDQGSLAPEIKKAIMMYNNPDSLRTLIGVSLGTGDEQLAELVMIKGVYDAIYDASYPKDELFSILEKTGKRTRSPYHRIIVSNLIRNIRFLEPGSYPPSFRLPDISGQTKTLSDFSGKYIYLNFSSRLSYGSLRQFPLLEQLSNTFRDQLDIVTIMPENDPETLRNLLDSKHYSWTFLMCPPSCSTIRDYRIKVFPSYILIGPDGRILLSPAPSPTENFISRFKQLLETSKMK